MEEKKLEFFTEEEFRKINTLRDKAYRIKTKYEKIKKKYGERKGSVFDGGFYIEIDTKLMTELEYEQYIKLEEQLNILDEIFA
jgi:hypothetical protein